MKTPRIATRINRLDIPPFVLFILDRLKGSGHQAYIVGGAIRDVCLGLPATDWDVTTSASPQEIRCIFRDRRHFSLKHQTVTLVESGTHYDVTTFRGDTPSLEEDLGRRDFTINAMALDLSTGRILDPVKGFDDLKRRIVRAPVDPAARFQEDPLRLLRAARFAVQFDFRIHGKTSAAMRGAAPSLGAVSRERIRDELVKILLGLTPSRAFRLMVQSNLLPQFLPELLEGHLKRQGSPPKYTILKHLLETVDRVTPLPVLRLAALFHDAAKPRVRVWMAPGRCVFPGHAEAGASLAAEVMGRLKFSREEIHAVAHLVRYHSIDGRKSWSDGAARRLLATVGRQSVASLLQLRRADLLASGPEPPDLSPLRGLERKLMRFMRQGVVGNLSELAVGGETVMQILGLPPGPRVGQVLAELWKTVLDHPEWNEKGQLKRILHEMRAATSCAPGAVSSSS